MPETIDYALLTTRVYDASDDNRTGVPTGWTEQRWAAEGHGQVYTSDIIR